MSSSIQFHYLIIGRCIGSKTVPGFNNVASVSSDDALRGLWPYMRIFPDAGVDKGQRLHVQYNSDTIRKSIENRLPGSSSVPTIRDNCLKLNSFSERWSLLSN